MDLTLMLGNLTNFLALDIGAAAEDMVNSVMLNINLAIYNLIVFLYNLFEVIATADFLNNELIQGIYQRVGLVLGLFMIFKLTFSLIQALINPSDDKIKGTTKMITRIIIVVVLLGSTNLIFTEARNLQNNLLVKDNIIAKVILGRNDNPDDNFGTRLAAETFFTFFTDNEPLYIDNKNSEEFARIISIDCVSGPGTQDDEYNCMNLFKMQVVNSNNLDLTKNIVNARTSDEGTFSAGAHYIEFNWLICLAVGLFMVYILISYCFAIGVRTVQLAFLELIAPIPIISYISPKDETAFNKWVKMCITTFIDVFIRVAIIYFIVFMIKGVLNSDIDSLLIGSASYSDEKQAFVAENLLWIKIVLFLALLMFAKKAPDLIHEMFPKTTSSIGFGLSMKERFKNMVGAGIVAGTVGAAGAAALGAAGAAAGNAYYGYKNGRGVVGTLKSSLAGAVSGGLRGAKAGFQNGIKGGAFGIGKAGLSGIQGASMARNQRDDKFGMKYGWGDKLKDQLAQTTGQRQKFGATGKIGGEIKELENNMANRQSAIESGLQQMRDLMNTHETLKSAFSFNIGTGNFERNQTIADYNDYLDKALSSKGTSRTKLQSDAMYRSQVTGNPDLIEYNNMLGALGIANEDEFDGFESNIANVGSLMDAQAADKKRKGQLEGSIPKKDK